MKPDRPERLLKELLDQLGLAQAAADESGVYRLLFDGDLAVACRSASGAILFEGDVSVLPADGDERERVLGALLDASTGTLREQRSALYLDDAGATLLLHRACFPAERGVLGMREALEEFLSSLERWRETARSLAVTAGAVGRPGARVSPQERLAMSLSR